METLNTINTEHAAIAATIALAVGIGIFLYRRIRPGK